MEDEQKLFDTTQPFIVEIKSGGTRRAELKYPTDPQWMKRTATQKISRVDLGRGKFKTEVAGLETIDLATFTDRLIKASADFDEYEASLVVDLLAKADVITAELVGEDQARVILEVFGGTIVEHVLNQPRRKQIVEFRKASANRTQSAKHVVTTLSLDPAARLFDELIVTKSGYAPESAIPIVHKEACVAELVKLLDPEA